MVNTQLALVGDGSAYDLPLTVLRERAKQEREARNRAQTQASATPSAGLVPGQSYAEGPVPAMVTRLQIPLLRLMFFFIKAAFAAIPALIILGVILWIAGHLLQLYFPELVKMQILIQFPH